MKTSKLTAILMGLIGVLVNSNVSLSETMDHGFIFGKEDFFISHLVARGHHSHQVSVTGRLIIESDEELYKFHYERSFSENSYFVFQAESIELTSLRRDQILRGYIFQSQIGKYEPNNVIVTNATFEIENVDLSVVNPFFKSKNKADHDSTEKISLFGGFPVKGTAYKGGCQGLPRDELAKKDALERAEAICSPYRPMRDSEWEIDSGCWDVPAGPHTGGVKYSYVNAISRFTCED